MYGKKVILQILFSFLHKKTVIPHWVAE